VPCGLELPIFDDLSSTADSTGPYPNAVSQPTGAQPEVGRNDDDVQPDGTAAMTRRG
jgi:hypothetical protein